MTKKLMCVGVNQYKRKDGSQGYKYMFLDDKDVAYVGYGDHDGLVPEEEICDEENYNPARAREYEVKRDVFNGTMTSRVQLKDIFA